MGQCPVVCPLHVDNDGTVAGGILTSRCPVICPVVPSLFRPTGLVLGLGLVRVSSRVRVKVRVSSMVCVNIRTSWVVNFTISLLAPTRVGVQ